MRSTNQFNIGQYVLSHSRGYLVLLAVAALSLSACHHQPKPVKQQHHRGANVDYSSLFARIQGRWMSYEYMLNLSKTTSPSASAAFMEGIFSFTIDSSRLVNDTLHCLAWVNGHEEQDVWIAFDSPDSMGQYSIGINRNATIDEQRSTSSGDNITRIKIDSPFMTIYTAAFDSIRYVYFDNLSRTSAPDYPIKHYTTAALFRGEYFVRDSNAIFGSSHIYFDPQHIGRIAGSPLYDSFDINVDVLSQTDSTDYMELFDSHRQTESRSFTYTIRKNVMKLYANLDSTPCVLIKTKPEDVLPIP